MIVKLILDLSPWPPEAEIRGYCAAENHAAPQNRVMGRGRRKVNRGTLRRRLSAVPDVREASKSEILDTQNGRPYHAAPVSATGQNHGYE
jgi:hypothetical protein